MPSFNFHTNTPIPFSALGAVSGGEDDNSGAVAAVDSNLTNGEELLIDDGVYRFASDVTINRKIVFARGGRIKPDNGVNVHLAAGYDADDRDHVFDISAGGSVTGDTVSRGYTTPQHWGALADRKSDDAPAIHAAIRYAKLHTSTKSGRFAEGLPVKFPAESWYVVNETIYVNRTIHLFGETHQYGRTQGGVEIRGADGLDAVMAIVEGPSAFIDYFGANSHIENLVVVPQPHTTVKQGFVHNTPCHFRYCAAIGFSEVGFHAHANTSGLTDNLFDHPGRSNANNTVPGGEHVINYNGTGAVQGNVNGSTYEYCRAPNNGIHGFACHGNNGGYVNYYNCDATNNKGAGFMDNTSIGSEYVCCHTSRNTFRVQHNGAIYMCIHANTADADNEPGVGANWKKYWIPAPSSTQYDKEWVVGADYFNPGGGFHSAAGNTLSSIVGCYTEGGIEIGVVARAQTTVVGGWAANRTFWHPEFKSASVVGPGAAPGYASTRFRGRTDPDDESTEYGVELGGFSYTGGTIMEMGDGRDDPSNGASAMRFAWNDIRGRYEWTDASNSTKAIYGVSGAGFTGTNYGNVSQVYFWANGMYLADGTTVGQRTVRMRATYNLSTIGGEAVQGDIWYYTNAQAGGKVGAVCVKTGKVGVDAVLKEFGAIDP